jgi:hypothetical protein
MSVLGWIVLSLICWTMLGLVLGSFVGKIIKGPALSVVSTIRPPERGSRSDVAA